MFVPFLSGPHPQYESLQESSTNSRSPVANSLRWTYSCWVTFALLQTDNVPDMSFKNIGINRVSTFVDRYSIASGTPNLAVEAITKENNGDIWTQSLFFKGKGVKIDYRCANPATIRAPKTLLVDETNQYDTILSADIVSMIQRGQSAMGATHITPSSKEDGLFVELSDSNRDAMSIQIGRAIVDTARAPVLFTHKYVGKTFLLPFKLNATGRIKISTNGLLLSMINNLSVYTIPE